LERVRKEQRVESWRHGATAPRLLCKRVHLLVQDGEAALSLAVEIEFLCRSIDSFSYSAWLRVSP
jgi:hypothetical protein